MFKHCLNFPESNTFHGPPPSPFYFVPSQNYHPFSINVVRFRPIQSFNKIVLSAKQNHGFLQKFVQKNRSFSKNYSFFKLVWTILICWVKKWSFLWTIKVVRTLIVIFLNDNIVHEKFHSFVRWMQISSYRPDVVDVEHWTVYTL